MRHPVDCEKRTDEEGGALGLTDSRKIADLVDGAVVSKWRVRREPVVDGLILTDIP